MECNDCLHCCLITPSPHHCQPEVSDGNIKATSMPTNSKTSRTSKKRDDAKITQSNPTLSKNDTARPKWPPLQPLLHAADLTLHSLLEDQILTIPHFWTANLCKTYVSFLSTLPLATTPGKPKRGDAVRVNDRFQVDDAQFAEQLWSSTALKETVENPVINGTVLSEDEKKALWGGEILGLNANIRIYRYSKGQFFDQHCTPTSFFWLEACNI